MPFAIVGYFDPDSDKAVHALWKTFADTGVCDYLHRSDNHPHIKFAMFDSVDIEETRARLADITRQTKKLELHFKNYGLYPNERPIVFLDISATIEILNLQLAIQEVFASFGTRSAGPYFDQGIWKPDCFLTIGLEPNKLDKATRLLLESPLPFNGSLDRIGLIEFHPAKRLFDYPLQENGAGNDHDHED
ncbi:2'-5' RNA ligase family protein [Gorillibacterium timonense]|uniref:2'-5' RNA ligase family protein n=1 Tax=Gorillibacterium timonense TaxID=1689269 RepID=UPI00071C3FE8|nr:2'-5' RNA ligase family protein [Gorillibacterium timonense]